MGRRGSVLRGNSTYQKILSRDRCGSQVLKQRERSTGWAEPPGGRQGSRVWSSECGRPFLRCGSERAEAALAPQHRASSVQTRAFVPSNSILGPPYPGSMRHRSPSGLLPPSLQVHVPGLAACTSCGCSLPGVVWVLIFVLHLENYP